MIAIFGRAGSGKGTQADRIARHFGLDHVTSSSAIRSQATEDQKWKVDHGVLLSRQEMLHIFKQQLDEMDHPEDSVLDGFPRTVEQAEDLWAMTQELDIPLEAIILLNVSRKVALQRMESRLTKEQRADDADADARERRLDAYDQLTEPAVRRLAELASLPILEVDGELDEDAVTMQIIDKLRDANVRGVSTL